MTDKIIGAKALVRREHPQCGPLLPSEFVPLAEETGMILPIGQWVLEEEAYRQAQLWQEQYPGDPPLIMCVNPSSRQFQHDNLVEDIARALRAPQALSGGLGEGRPLVREWSRRRDRGQGHRVQHN